MPFVRIQERNLKNGLFDAVLGVFYLVLIQKHCSIIMIASSLISMLQNNFKFISANFGIS